MTSSSAPVIHLPRVDLTARPGRVLGLYGLVGSGRSRFLRSLIGMEPLLGGSITLFGRPYRPKGPRQAAQRGVVLVTEDRKMDGFIPQLDAKRNVALPVFERVCQVYDPSTLRVRDGSLRSLA
jgi:ABC-type sugar transport system ATPase subunit